MFKTKSIRIISIIGILSLLILQYIWFKNSYVLMEYDVLTKTEKCLSKSIEDEMFERLKTSSVGMNVNNTPLITDNEVVIAGGEVNKTNDINQGLQEVLVVLGKPCSIERLDSLFKESLEDNLDFVPSYSIRLVNDSLEKVEKKNKYTLYNKVTENQYVEVNLNSPLGSILREAQIILFFSLLLAMLIGLILIIQLKGMLRENKFVIFIKEYTHALTHELKTPISGIYMSASQLASGKFEDKPDLRSRHYQICKDQSSKLLSTVERILLVAKAEHTKIIPNFEIIEVKPFVDKIANSFSITNFRNKDLYISTKFQNDDIKASFDPALIENVISNLIDNAIKYSESTVRIEIKCDLKDDKFRIRVKDNGFGISDKEKKHIFDNFERGNRIQNKGIDGFGIGLNYVHKVIKAHKGSIDVESIEGKGSEFIIELPN